MIEFVHDNAFILFAPSVIFYEFVIDILPTFPLLFNEILQLLQYETVNKELSYNIVAVTLQPVQFCSVMLFVFPVLIVQFVQLINIAL